MQHPALPPVAERVAEKLRQERAEMRALFDRARQVVLERRMARLAEEAGRRIVATQKVDSAPSDASVPDHFQRVKKTHQLQGLQPDLPLDRDSTT